MKCSCMTLSKKVVLMERLFSNFRMGTCSQPIRGLTFLFLSFTPLFAQMKAVKLSLLFIVSLCIQMAWPDEVTVTLQNGVNDYTGCSDIHIGNEEDNPCSDGVNSGEYTKLVLTFFKC